MSAETLFPEGVALGRFLGYPECCINYFALRSVGLQFGILIPVPKNAPLFGSGFTPCPECMFKSEDELRATIQANRKCPTPFPSYEESTEHARLPDNSARSAPIST